MHAIILAGGFGTRLRSVVSDVPKPLAPVAGRPFLAWLIDALVAGGVTQVMLSVYHEHQKIRDYFDAHPFSIPLTYAIESTPLGTGGAIAFAMRSHASEAPVLVLNGDTFVRIDYRGLYKNHDKDAFLTMALRSVSDTGRYSDVQVKDGKVTAFTSGVAGKAGLINAGIYVISPQLFTRFPMPEAFSFEQDFLLRYVGEILPRYRLADDYFIDIGVPEDYARSCQELPTLFCPT